jgi:opacity protein-like surface antigen
MKKVQIISLFIFFIISHLDCLLAQSSNNSISADNDYLKKGKIAAVFEMGTIFSRSDFFEGYNFLFKYHISDYTAVRISFNLNGGKFNDNYISSYTYDWSSYGYESSANIQIYLTKRSYVKPFISIGPTFFKEHNDVINSDGEYFEDKWNAGLMLTLGTEVFIKDNISLIGEYLIKGTYGKIKKFNRHNAEIKNETNVKQMFLTGKTARLGFSVYF